MILQDRCAQESGCGPQVLLTAPDLEAPAPEAPMCFSVWVVTVGRRWFPEFEALDPKHQALNLTTKTSKTTKSLEEAITSLKEQQGRSTPHPGKSQEKIPSPNQHGGFQTLGGTVWASPIVRITVLWNLSWGLPILKNLPHGA